jgi:2-polyprenyl-6-methoxyphenol hydroxylase-like FAD-dependent oxidoreductase
MSIGGGPAGLYFAILMKQADPAYDVTVVERNRPDDTFGFGVVFSDATLEHFAAADPESHAEISRALAHWDDIDIHYQGQVVTSSGHGFAGLSRQGLLDILQRRCRQLGVRLAFEQDVTDLEQFADADLVLAADGVNSAVRARYAAHFEPAIDWRSNRFVWLGTSCPFAAFTFLFKEDEHGLWRVHAYRYDQRFSTFILETTAATWARAGLDRAREDETVAFAERLFARELAGHRILKNRSLWRSFPTVRNARWHWGNVVLVGDAAHTAHFSVGSGTKLAMEDAIALSRALRRHADLPNALSAYEAERRRPVEALQRAAQASLEWFEQTERYHGRLEPVQFAFSLLTRSVRVTHESLRARDPRLVESIDRWFAGRAADQSGVRVESESAPLPMLTPFRLRELVLRNRIVTCLDDDDRASFDSRTAGAALVLLRATSAGGDRWPGAAVGLRLDGRSSVRDLVSAARMADEAGFDLLELDLARPDLDLFEAVRAVWPAARPISVNLSAVEDPVEPARSLRARGCDIVRIERPALSDRIRLETGIPTMTAAASADIDSLLAAGRADLCLLAGAPSPSQAGGFALTDRSA